MMAYPPYHYAAALHASLAGKDAAQAQKITDAFVSMVARNGHASLGKKIAQEYAVYASEREGIFSGILFVAHPMNPALKKDIAKKISERLAHEHIREIHFEEKTDPSLISGFTAQVKDIFIDASMNGALRRVYEELQKVVA